MLALVTAVTLQTLSGVPSRDVSTTLAAYYQSRSSSPSSLRRCDADAGDLCFGGDHDRQRCRDAGSCPTERESSRFVERLTELATASEAPGAALSHAVYALSKFGQPTRALELLSGCSDRFPCSLLRGLVLARAGASDQAEEAFLDGLAASPDSVRARLEDIGALLGDSDIAEYSSLSGGKRLAFQDRFWWLADPLHSLPGNDRWVAHVARRLELGLHAQIIQAVGSTHPAGHELSVIRRGFEDSWELPEGAPFRMWVSSRGAPVHAIPESRVNAPLTAVRYSLLASSNDEAFSPPYSPIEDLAHQVGRFRDSAGQQIAVATDGSEAAGVVHLVVSSKPGAADLSLVWQGMEDRAVFRIDLPTDTVLMSLESRTGRSARRARGGLAPLDGSGFGLSDVIFVQPGPEGGPSDRESATARMLAARSVPAGVSLGLYWEVYEAAAGPLGYSLSIEDANQGSRPLQAALRLLGFGGETAGSTLSWRDVSTGDGTHPVGVEIDLGILSPGAYSLTLDVSSGEQVASTSWPLTIAPTR